MAENSKIEWTDHTVNFWWGCERVSPGCKNCYAEALAKRYGKNSWGSNPRAPRIEKAVAECAKYDKAAAKAGRKALVFTNSMADVFEDHPDLYCARGVALDTMERCTNLIFQVLTKRPENIAKFVPTKWLRGDWPANIWIGASVEDQTRADARIPELLKVPAAVRFLSVEPMLGAVNLRPCLPHPSETKCPLCGFILFKRVLNVHAGTIGAPNNPEPETCPNDGMPMEILLDGIRWVIVGGESGPRKRPFNCDWARTIRDDCKTTGVAFFMKQVDKVQPIPADLMIREFPAGFERTRAGAER